MSGSDGRSWAELARETRTAMENEKRIADLEAQVGRLISEIPHEGPHARAELAHRRIDTLREAVEALAIAVGELSKKANRQEAIVTAACTVLEGLSVDVRALEREMGREA
jgi:hypothetical protein